MISNFCFQQQEALAAKVTEDKAKLEKKKLEEQETAEKRIKEEEEAKMRAQLIAKQQELLRIQEQKLELELAAARAKLEQQAKQLELKEQLVCSYMT